MPKASALRFHPSNESTARAEPPGAPEITRVLRHWRAPADCFGANPVASALGNFAKCDPDEAVPTYHEGCSTAFKTGTFYFGGNRNFLFWSDTNGAIVAADIIGTVNIGSTQSNVSFNRSLFKIGTAVRSIRALYQVHLWFVPE